MSAGASRKTQMVVVASRLMAVTKGDPLLSVTVHSLFWTLIRLRPSIHSCNFDRLTVVALLRFKRTAVDLLGLLLVDSIV